MVRVSVHRMAYVAAVALLAAAAVACGGDDEAAALARVTCAIVEDANGNAPIDMLEGIRTAEAAGVSEGRFRAALLAECGLDPPPRSTLEQLNGEGA